MADDGSSTGVLRDELGTLPAGDVRQCLVALSDSPKVRDLFDYRFDEGTFKGHSFGNLLLTALEKVTGNFSEAVETASDILRVNGVVVPATLDNIRLKMEWPEKSLILHGERVIDAEYFRYDPRKAKLSLVPNATANPMALAAIEQADLVVIAPGDLYTSLGPLLVIDGIGEALMNTRALKVYVSNLVSKKGQTDNFTVGDHAAEIKRFAGAPFLDYVLHNDEEPSPEVAAAYKSEGGFVAKIDAARMAGEHYRTVSGRLLGKMAEPEKNEGIAIRRTLIRHDTRQVAKLLLELYRGERA